MLISNEGSARASDVQVYADKLDVKSAAGAFQLEPRFLPMNLLWANVGSPYVSLPPGAKRHCDLAHIIDPAHRASFPAEDLPTVALARTVLSFDVEAKANNMGYLVGPGVYRLTVLLSAAEIKPQRYVIELNHTGSWSSNETTMLSTGVGVTLVKEQASIRQSPESAGAG
jgi:hypothetical protein